MTRFPSLHAAAVVALISRCVRIRSFLTRPAHIRVSITPARARGGHRTESVSVLILRHITLQFTTLYCPDVLLPCVCVYCPALISPCRLCARCVTLCTVCVCVCSCISTQLGCDLHSTRCVKHTGLLYHIEKKTT